MASKHRITLTLSENQITLLHQLADQAARAEGRAVSPAEIVRRTLADHFGPDWPDPDSDLTWGGFSPAARRARWAARSVEGDMWHITWERFFGGQITPEEYLAKIQGGDLERHLRDDLAALWQGSPAEELDSATAKLTAYLRAIQDALDSHAG